MTMSEDRTTSTYNPETSLSLQCVMSYDLNYNCRVLVGLSSIQFRILYVEYC